MVSYFYFVRIVAERVAIIAFNSLAREPFWISMAFYDVEKKIRFSESAYFEFNEDSSIKVFSPPVFCSFISSRDLIFRFTVGHAQELPADGS